MQVGSRCETYYGENYCVTVMCGYYTVWFRYVIKPCEGWVPDDTWYLIRMFGNNYVRACNKVSLRCMSDVVYGWRKRDVLNKVWTA